MCKKRKKLTVTLTPDEMEQCPGFAERMENHHRNNGNRAAAIVRKIAKRFGVDPGTVQRISRPFEPAAANAVP